MPVSYGKLKRKYNVRKQLSLSPKKHSVRECDNEFLNSSQNLFSITSNSTETLKSSSIESTESIFESSLNTTDLEENSLDGQPSSPIFKSQSNIEFDSYFKGFEELDEYDVNSSKHQKNTHNRKKTTFFAKERSLVHCKKDNLNSKLLIDLSDDGFSSEISASLQTLNSRLFEIQSQVKSLDHENLLVDSVEVQTSTVHDSADHGVRHYGSIRSFVHGSESLSDAEEEEEEEVKEKKFDGRAPKSTNNGVNHKNKVRFVYDDPYPLPSSKCQSLEELRRSGELGNSKLEYDMILEQLKKATHYGKKDLSELLQLKLSLLNKIESDVSLKNYLQRSIVCKTNCTFNRAMKDLLKVSPKDFIVNFQLITFFRLTGWKELDIVSAIGQVQSMGDLSIKEYSNNHLNSPKRLLTDLLGDWINHFAKLSTYQIAMKMLDSIGTAGMEELTEEEKYAVIDFCDLALHSLNTDLLLLSLKYLRLNPSLLQGGNNTNISKSLARLLLAFPFQADDAKVMNLILECSIIIVCGPEFSAGIKSSTVMFSKKVWHKLWDIVQTYNVLDKCNNLSEIKQNQCLIAIGYLFSFITFDTEVSASDLSPLSDFLAFADHESKTTSFNVLQIHCIGYLGCISYHFFRRSNLLFDKKLGWIKNTLEVHQNSEFKSQEILSREIGRILREI